MKCKKNTCVTPYLVYMYAVCVLFVPVSVKAQTGDTGDLSDEAIAVDRDIALEDFEDFEDFEDSEDFEERESTGASVVPNATILIENITVILDGNIYTNPHNDTELSQGDTKLEVLFSEISIRQKDVLSKKRLDTTIMLSTTRINQTAYYTNTKIEYAVNEKENTTEEDIVPVTVFISVDSAYPYIFFGGNAYASFGYKIPNGTVSMYHAGANRIEAHYHDARTVFMYSVHVLFARTVSTGAHYLYGVY